MQIALVSSGKTSVRTAADRVVEHGNVFGHADRILGWEHYSKLPDPRPPRLHADRQVQHYRIVGELESFRVEIVLGKAYRVVTEVVSEARLLRNIRNMRP